MTKTQLAPRNSMWGEDATCTVIRVTQQLVNVK